MTSRRAVAQLPAAEMGNQPGGEQGAPPDQEPTMASALDQNITRVATTYKRETEQEAEAAAQYREGLIESNPQTNYKYGRKLGEGGFGVVIEATRKSDGVTFAMKEINKGNAAVKDSYLAREIGLMVQCKHKNLIKIEETYFHRNRLYIIMELVPMPGPNIAPDLFSWLTEDAPGCLGFANAATEHQVAVIVKLVAEAISYLNTELQAIHRDLKPENVLVGPDGIENLKVTDFGLARMGVMDGQAQQFTFKAGTEGYMAPEVVNRQEAVDGKVSYGSEPFKVDVFSLGVIMFICLCKTPPFGVGPGANQAVLRGDYQMDPSMWRGRTQGSKELIKKMLENSQADRCTLADVLQDPWVTGNS